MKKLIYVFFLNFIIFVQTAQSGSIRNNDVFLEEAQNHPVAVVPQPNPLVDVENWSGGLDHNIWTSIFHVCKDHNWTSLQYHGDWIDVMSYPKLLEVLQSGELSNALNGSDDPDIRALVAILPQV